MSELIGLRVELGIAQPFVSAGESQRARSRIDRPLEEQVQVLNRRNQVGVRELGVL